MNTTTLTSHYKAKGWAITTPLPAGKKYPPATGITGNVDYLKRLEAAETAWNNAEPGCNIGLVMATDNPEFDVIAIDVDHYGDKHGADNLAELEPQLGSLELATVPRSTRRGADSRSAQFPFKVAKGYSWATSVCEAVDIVQAGHRYSAVYPSVVDGEEYRWYLGENEIEIPAIEDLPWLSEAWQDYLKPTPARAAAHKADVESFKAALLWLKERCLPGDAEAVEVNPNARHDSMHTAVNELVSGAVFSGRPGVLASLKSLRKEFLTATQDENREHEFKQSVIGAVAYAKGQIEAGEEPETNWNELQARLGDFSALADFNAGFQALFAEPEPSSSRGTARTYGKLSFTSLETAPILSAEWVWGGEGIGGIPVGGLTIITGKPADGKSTACRWLAAEITNGTLEGTWLGAPHDVLYLHAEESLDHMVTPSLKANGADMARVHVMQSPVDPREDIDDLIAFCLDNDVRAVFVDPLTSYMGGVDTHRNADVREALKPWSRLAEEIEGTVIAIVHQNKGSSGDIVAGINGSAAYSEVARAIFGTAVDTETGTRVISQSKCSLSGTGMPPREYSLENVNLKADSGKVKPVARFSLGEVTDVTAGDIFLKNRKISSGEAQTAKSWLREYLEINPGSLKADVVKAGKGLYSESSLEKAASDLNVRKAFDNRKVVWHLN